MTDQDNTAPAVWDPTARGGAGGWVRRKPADAPPAPPAGRPVAPPFPAPGQPGAAAPGASPSAPPPGPGEVGDEGPMLAARPYVTAAPQAPARPATPTPPFGQPGQPAGAPPMGPPAVAQPPMGQPPAGQPPMGQAPFGQPPMGQPPFGQPPMGQPPFGQPPMGQPPMGPPPLMGQPHAAAPPFAAPPPQGFPGPAQSGFPPFAQQPPQQFPQQPQPFPQRPDHNGYAGYEDVGSYDDEEPRSRAPLFIAVGVVLAVALVGGTVWALQGDGGKGGKQASSGTSSAAPQPAPAQSGPTGSPAPDGGSSSANSTGGPNGAAQAKTLSDLLSQAESTRTQIGSAVAKVRSCPAKPEVDKAADIFDAGGKQRDQLMDQLGKLNLGDVPNGSDLAQLLHTAWQQSGDIDRAYAAWARTVSSQGCQNGTAPATPDYKKADELNPQATKSKNDFITKWKPVADSFNLPESSADRI